MSATKCSFAVFESQITPQNPPLTAWGQKHCKWRKLILDHKDLNFERGITEKVNAVRVTDL